MKILIIPGLTLPPPSDVDLDRVRAAAGDNATVIVTSQREAITHAPGTDVILGFVPQDLFAASTSLRWVHAIASGVDAFLYSAFVASDVVLTSEKGLVGEHLADHGFGLLLMLTRQLKTADRLGADSWNHRPEMRHQEIELTGLTMGIVGYGGTGRAVAKRAVAFGMRCVAIDKDAVSRGEHIEHLYGLDGFDELLAQSHVIAVCCPLTPLTRDWFDARAFAKIKRGAFLVNVTRGEVMVEDALVAALRDGTLRGAALDVAPREPLPADSPLWSMPHVVMTPHTAGASQYRAARNIDRFVHNLERLARNEPLEGVIDKTQGY